MVEVTTDALRLVHLYGPLALCLFAFLETSMLFPFLPSEVVAPAAAAVLVSDPTTFFVFVLAASVGGTTRAFVPFSVFRGTRLGLADWIRDRIHVSDERIAQGQEWFRQWGWSSVLWGRFLPVLRSVVSIPAGLAHMPPKRFGALTAAGTVGFYAATGGVVYYGRQQSLFAAVMAFATDNPVRTIVMLLILLGNGLLLRNWFRRRNL